MDRSQLVDDNALTESEVYRDMMRSYFSVSGYLYSHVGIKSSQEW
jgi:hypothetical protein